MTTEVVVVGLGDTGVLVASKISRFAKVTAITCSPGLVSGQELGMRITNPTLWKQLYWHQYAQFQQLNQVNICTGKVVNLAPESQQVTVQTSTGIQQIPYQMLIIATGVSNGFWRQADLATVNVIQQQLTQQQEKFHLANDIAIVGAGAAGVSCAVNLAITYPKKTITLYYPNQTGLVDHHPRVWARLVTELTALGVILRPMHRAVLPSTDLTQLNGGEIEFSSGQPSAAAELILWTVGKVKPNTEFLPAQWLDAAGFVQVEPTLQVRSTENVFAIGDVAATDRLRSSARNRADKLLVRNLKFYLAGKKLQKFRPVNRRWGSIVGLQPSGLKIFTPNGSVFSIPRPIVTKFLWPWIVNRGIYGGISDSTKQINRSIPK